MDVVAIVALTSSLGAIIIAVLTHLKHSECCKGMMSCDTRGRDSLPSSPIEVQEDTPVLIRKYTKYNKDSHTESEI